MPISERENFKLGHYHSVGTIARSGLFPQPYRTVTK
jgi:hypothetical protein